MSVDLPSILPCPFCGYVGLTFGEGSTFRWLSYACEGCGMGSETRVKTIGEGEPAQWMESAKRRAVDEWNRRFPEVKKEQ